jgi:hypothetical protein
MNILRRKYFIYPEIQLPLLKQIAIGLTLLTILQVSGVILSMHWLEAVSKADISIVVDQRVLGPWKTLLFLSVCIPIVLNMAIGLSIVLYVSNRFAGPLFRLEKEIDLFLNGEKKELKVKFRNNDYLHSLAEKINKLKA